MSFGASGPRAQHQGGEAEAAAGEVAGGTEENASLTRNREAIVKETSSLRPCSTRRERCLRKWSERPNGNKKIAEVLMSLGQPQLEAGASAAVPLCVSLLGHHGLEECTAAGLEGAMIAALEVEASEDTEKEKQRQRALVSLAATLENQMCVWLAANSALQELRINPSEEMPYFLRSSTIGRRKGETHRAKIHFLYSFENPGAPSNKRARAARGRPPSGCRRNLTPLCSSKL